MPPAVEDRGPAVRPRIRRRFAWVLIGILAQAGLLAATLPVEGLGAPAWHHLATLGLVLLLVAAAWRPLTQSRTVLSLTLAVSTLLAIASGFFILYTKPWLKANELVDWAKFWHLLWSWATLALFLLHTWVNRAALVRHWRRLLRRPGFALAHHALLATVLIAIPLTWSGWGRAAIHDANYVLLTFYTWIVVVGPFYALWALVTWTPPHAMGRLRKSLARSHVRPWTDVALVPATLLANLSGFPLTFWKDEVQGAGFKFVGKYWHTWPSIVFAVLIFMHTIHLWRPMRAYGRRWGRWVGDASAS